MSENSIPKSSPYISENNRLKGVYTDLNEEIDIESNINNKGEKNIAKSIYLFNMSKIIIKIIYSIYH